MIAVDTLEITTDLLSIMKKLPNFVYIMIAFFEVYLYKASAKETASYWIQQLFVRLVSCVFSLLLWAWKEEKEKHKNKQIYSLISLKRRKQRLVSWWSDSWNFDYLLLVSSRHLRGTLFHIVMAITISTCLKNSSLSSLFSSFAEIVLFSINFHLVHQRERVSIKRKILLYALFQWKGLDPLVFTSFQGGAYEAAFRSEGSSDVPNLNQKLVS